MKDPIVLAAIISSSFAFIASLITAIISIRNLKLQRRLSNDSLQIEYLNHKLKTLQEEKNRITSRKFSPLGTKISKDNFDSVFAEIIDESFRLINLISEKIHPYISSDLKIIQNKMRRISGFLAAERSKLFFGNSKDHDEYVDVKNEDPIALVIKLEEELLEILNIEIKDCISKIEVISGLS